VSRNGVFPAALLLHQKIGAEQRLDVMAELAGRSHVEPFHELRTGQRLPQHRAENVQALPVPERAAIACTSITVINYVIT